MALLPSRCCDYCGDRVELKFGEYKQRGRCLLHFSFCSKECQYDRFDPGWREFVSATLAKADMKPSWTPAPKKPFRLSTDFV